MNDRKKTFILGLGNQKCGTTWLYKYLTESSFFFEGFAKEYHIWDAIDLPLLNNNKVKINKTNKIRNFLGLRFNSVKLNRYAMQNNSDFYFDYFSSLYSSQKYITSDITPSYSGLKAERLQKIKDKFEERNIEVKAVILIREPLSRIKSAVRFNLDRGSYGEGINVGETNFKDALDQYYKSEHCALRTMYNNVISESKKVFNDEQLYIGFYENMFSQGEIIRLSKFLGVDSNSEYGSVKVNKTRNEVEPTNIDLIVKEYYSDVYDFCFENYPITKKLWGNG